MHRRSILTKTGKGLMEATGKTSNLPRDLRNVLKEIDGKVSVSALLTRLEKFTEPKLIEALSGLERDGYLREFMGSQDSGGQAPVGRWPISEAPADSGEDLDFTAIIPAKPAAKESEEDRLQARSREITRQAQAARARVEAEQRAKLADDPKARAEAQAKAQALALDQARREAEERQRREGEEKARRELEARARLDAEEHARREAEDRQRREIQERTRRENEEKTHREAEERTRREVEGRVRREAEERVRREIDEQVRRETEALKLREETERQRRIEEERARREAEEMERRKREEREHAERMARIEMDSRAKVEAEERARREQEERARREEEERARREEELRRRSQDEARRRKEAQEHQEAEEREARGRKEAQAREARERAKQQEEAARRELEQKIQEEEERERREREERARREAEEKAAEQEKARHREQGEDAEEETRRVAAEERQAREEEKSRVREEAEARKAQRARERAGEESWRGDEDAEKERGKPARTPADWTSKRSGSLTRQIAVMLLLLLVIGVAVLPFVPMESGPYEKAAQEWLGAPVKIGSTNMTLLPSPRLKFEKVVIGSDPQMRVASVDAVPDIASLIADKKIFRSLELSGVVFPAKYLPVLLSDKGRSNSLRVEHIIAKGLKLDIRELNLPPLDVNARLGANGAVQSVILSNAERKLSVILMPQGKRTAIEISADSFPLPIGADLVLGEFAAKGTLIAGELALSEVEGRAFGGRVLGNARLRWSSEGWNLDGELNARQIEAAKLAAPILAGGLLEGKGVYGMKAATLDKLFASARFEGDFTIQKGSLTNVDMTRLLQGGSAGGGTTLFSEMSGVVSADPSRLVARQLRLAAGLLNGTGQVEMDSQKNLSGRLQIELRAQTVQARATLALAGSLREPQFRRSN